MASAPNKSLAEQNAIASTFSYAQAAKVQAQDTIGAVDSNESINTDTHHNSGNGSSSLNADLESSSDVRATGTEQAPATMSTSLKEEASTPVMPSSSDATWERQPAKTDTTDKPIEGTEGRRSKKSKKTKDAEKEAEKAKEEAKLELLVAAPMPTVNIWQQRREAQAAKIKPTSVTTQHAQNPVATPAVNGGPVQNASKSSDKKKAKDEAAVSNQQGTQGKAQKKNTDGGNREAGSKRTAPRGSREDRLAPPPVEDAVSWPTPETALEEEKRKVVEKGDEKDENVSKQPRTKEKWVPVPYTPSVTFNTPLPTRGGRGRGGARGGRDAGGRGGHATNGANTMEKVSGQSPVNGVAPEARERGRDGSNNTRATSLPPHASKRSAVDGQQNTRDQRKSSTSTPNDKPKGNELSKSDKESASEDRHTSTATQTEAGYESSLNQVADSTQTNGIINGNGANGPSQIKYGESDRRHSQDNRSSENQKGSAAFARGENRSDRGRGGFRGTRGGHSNFANGSSHVFTNGHASQAQNGFVPRANAGPYSPPLQAPTFNAQFGSAAGRNGRGNPRSQSIPNGLPYGRYPANGNGVQHMNPLQPSTQMADYSGQQAANGQYPHYIDQWAILSMVSMQLEYYFSIDNLCKDVFLRKHMDSQGFVFLNFIATFKRIEKLTQDFESLRIAVQNVPSIEHIVGPDGFDRVRRREGWEQWVLNIEERDEAAKNAGPTQLLPPQSLRHMNPQMHMSGHYMPSPPLFSPNGTEMSYRSNGIEGSMNGSSINGGSHPVETALSAAVPNFAPGAPVLNGASYVTEETTFTDADVENLNLVSKPRDSAKAKAAPFHNSTSRTFSNGSIDSRAFADDAHRATHQTGDVKNEVTESESSTNSPSKQSDVSPPVMWVKGQRGQAPIDPNHATEPYTSVRAKALRQRETTPPGQTHSDMKIIYEFWSHFLVRNFNPSMYEEFRQFAAEDAFQRKTMVGMDNLITYYDEVLNSKKKTIPERIAEHYIELVKTEATSQDRPAFAKLRASWRNGALDLKSRKRIDKLVDAELRKELES